MKTECSELSVYSSLCMFSDVPMVTLRMGSSLNPDDIKEGDDVYFECNIRANPKAYRLAWFHNVSTNKSFYGYCYEKRNSKLTIKDRSHKITDAYIFRNSNTTCIAPRWIMQTFVDCHKKQFLEMEI